MLPAVSTGPLDPAWSPDGKWIAFSMRGDIWKVPADGGEAIALTRGPAYHFEPAWSPDGTRIALSMDIDGNLDIGVVNADGGDVERLTTDRRVDVEPAWSRDGAALYFVTARGGNFDIYRYRLRDKSADTFVAGPRDQIQPAVSPDGKQLAYVAPCEAASAPAASGSSLSAAARRASCTTRRPSTACGRRGRRTGSRSSSFRRAGLERHRRRPGRRRQPVVLTADAMDEFAPSVSPEGDRFAFVSNRSGPMMLYTAPIGGGPMASWRKWRSRRAKRPHRPAACECVSLGPDGQPTARARLPARGRRARLHAGRRFPPRHRRDRNALLPHDGRVRGRGAGRRDCASRRCAAASTGRASTTSMCPPAAPPTSRCARSA